MFSSQSASILLHLQDDTLSPPTVTPIAYSKIDSSFFPTSPDFRGGNGLHDKLSNRRSLLSRTVTTTATNSTSVGLPDISMPSNFPRSDFPTNSSLVLTNLHTNRVSFGHTIPCNFREPLSLSNITRLKNIPLQAILESPSVSVPSPSPQPRKYSTYAERISTTSAFTDGISSAISSPKLKKTGNETWEELKGGVPLKQFQQSSSVGGRTLPSVDVKKMSDLL